MPNRAVAIAKQRVCVKSVPGKLASPDFRRRHEHFLSVAPDRTIHSTEARNGCRGRWLLFSDDEWGGSKGKPMPEDQVNVRYMVDDVQASVDWYTGNLGFKLLSS